MEKIWQRIAAINTELTECVQRAKAENRDFSKEEQDRINELTREKHYLSAEVTASTMQRQQVSVPADSLAEVVRSAVRNKVQTELILREEGAGTTTVVDNTIKTDDIANIKPLTVGEIIHSVEEKLIWDKLGIRMPSGLAGQYEWPVVGDMTAEFAGEGVELTDKKIEISKISAVQQRVGITAALTRESIFNSRGLIESLVREEMPKAIARLMNNMTLSATKIAGQNLQGPFVTATAKSAKFDFKGLNGIKAFLLGKGYDVEGMVWVMDAATKATLEGTPKDAGSGIMCVENDRLCGLPIQISSKMNGKIGLGDFRFQVVGMFGTPSFVVDPYTLATKGKVRFTINMNYGTATLDKDAFVLVTEQA